MRKTDKQMEEIEKEDRVEMKVAKKEAHVDGMEHKTTPKKPAPIVSDMGKAVKHLEMDTERGQHKPAVGGFKDHNHSY